MTTINEPRCYARECKHWQGTREKPGTEQQDFPVFIHTCAAFPYPREIPDEIADGTNDHTTPYPGDNGIQYEKATKTIDDGLRLRITGYVGEKEPMGK